MKKKAAKSSVIGGRGRIPRVRIAVLDGTGLKDKYVTKITVYDLSPEDVVGPIRVLVTTIRDKKLELAKKGFEA